MEHMLLKVAATTTTDLGEFEAVISTESIDREKDIVSADAMVAALHKWNRPVPLSWNHSTKADDIFGHIDPQSARNVNGEVVINGNADLSSAVGAEAWRSFKNRTVGFSFGYLIPDGGSSKRAGGGRNITELDVFEVTATPTPMNNDTRVLSTKAMADMTPADLLAGMIEMAQAYIASPPDAEDADEMQGILDDLRELVADVDDAADAAEDATGKRLDRRLARAKQLIDSHAVRIGEQRRMDPLKAKADALVLELMSNGESLQQPSQDQEPVPRVSVADVRRQMHQATLDALIGGLDLE